MSTLESLGQATMAGDQNKTAELTQQALDEGLTVEQILQEGFIPAMKVVGDEFAEGIRYIPEMLLAARAMQHGMEVVKPLLAGGELKTMATVVLGTVKGDLHDIGKNLVGMMLEGSGMKVIDLGVDAPPERFVEAVKEHRADFVALSALLTTTMPSMKDTIDALQEAGLRDRCRVLVGGAPVNQKFADQIGADGYGGNATEAVNRVKELLG